MKRATLVLSAIILSAGIACAQDATTATESATSAPARRPRPEGMFTSASAQRGAEMQKIMEEGYKAAGLSDEQVQKAKDLDAKIRDARTRGDKDTFRSLRAEKDKIMTAEQKKAFAEHMSKMGPMRQARRQAMEDRQTTAAK